MVGEQFYQNTIRLSRLHNEATKIAVSFSLPTPAVQLFVHELHVAYANPLMPSWSATLLMIARTINV
jgi:hypothetical protein